MLDVGKNARIGLLGTDSKGVPVKSPRTLTVTYVAGDNTAVVYVEPQMWLNIDFGERAALSFDVVLYEVGSILDSYQKCWGRGYWLTARTTESVNS